MIRKRLSSTALVVIAAMVLAIFLPLAMVGRAQASNVAGRVYAWGQGDSGQLGNNSKANSSIPVEVQDILGVAAIAGGGYHSLALKSDGTVWAWGQGGNGQLGNNSTEDSSIPVQVQGLTDIGAIAGGVDHSLALKSDGTVWAWGANGDGQLGNSSVIIKSLVPVQVEYLTGVQAIDAGAYFSMALKSDGTVWAWGQNMSGQLGNNTTMSSPIPVQAQDLSGVQAVSAGGFHSMALKSDGTVWAWGANGSGQLGNNSTTESHVPIEVSGFTGVQAISGGGSHSMALKSDGTVWAWGWNGWGQLGDNSTTDSHVPIEVPGLTGFQAVSGGYWHSLALKSDGTVWAWGEGDSGQLGNNSTGNSSVPVEVQGLTNMDAISGGGSHSLALISTNPVAASVVGTGGTVSPDSQDVNYGGTAEITIQPVSGYHIDTITVNGVAQTPPFASPFEITNVIEPLNVVVTFAPNIRTWYFADSTTRTGFQEYLCLGNPGASDASATVTYLFSGGVSATDHVIIPAGGRATLDVNANPEVGPDKDFSVEVSSTSNIFCERPMYFDYQGAITGGSDVVAATSPATTFYFAEGYTGAGFDEYVCVLNPGDTDANLTFKFFTEEAGEKDYSGPGWVCPAHSRVTFKVNDILGGSYQASLQLVSNQPVVAERPMYFIYTSMSGDAWSGGHAVTGATSLSQEYYFAEGTTRAGFEEWLTLANPSASAINVNAVYQLAPGQGDEVTRTYNVPAHGRASIFVNDSTQGVGPGKDASVYLNSTSQFLAERPMYFDYTYAGGDWTGGSCVIGATSPAAVWFFAEGCTLPGFHEWLTLQNPMGIDAAVTIEYYGATGALGSRDLTVPANSRISVFVNDPTQGGPGQQISARIGVHYEITDVGASFPGGIVVERPMYFDYNGWTGGSDALGYPSRPAPL